MAGRHGSRSRKLRAHTLITSAKRRGARQVEQGCIPSELVPQRGCTPKSQPSPPHVLNSNHHTPDPQRSKDKIYLTSKKLCKRERKLVLKGKQTTKLYVESRFQQNYLFFRMKVEGMFARTAAQGLLKVPQRKTLFTSTEERALGKIQ